MESKLVLGTLKRTAILGVLLLVPAFANAQNTDSPAINDLLKEARVHAVQAENDADTLASYTRGRLSWESHASRLIYMKEHAHDLIVDFNKLKAMRAEGSPWQQEAIDQINPMLHEMADHLTATITHLNENHSKVHFPAYQDYARGNWELMSKTARLINDFVEYGENKADVLALERNLDLPLTASEKP